MTWDPKKIKANMNFSPLEVIILMEAYFHPNFKVDSSKTNNYNALKSLDSNELIETYSSELIHITDKGRAVVEKMCNTPMPKIKWVFE